MIEVTTEQLESIPLALDFFSRADTEPAQPWDRRTPSFYGVLKEERGSFTLNHLLSRNKQFNHMAIRITEKNLPRAIRPPFSRPGASPHRPKMTLPFIQIIDPESKMVIFVASKKRRSTAGYQVQFLI
jgi:hypothetical protein